MSRFAHDLRLRWLVVVMTLLGLTTPTALATVTVALASSGATMHSCCASSESVAADPATSSCCSAAPVDEQTSSCCSTDDARSEGCACNERGCDGDCTCPKPCCAPVKPLVFHRPFVPHAHAARAGVRLPRLHELVVSHDGARALLRPPRA